MTADHAPVDQTLLELAALADAGELAAPLAHEVNNYLNVLLLHLATLELRVPSEIRPDLAEVRRQGKQLAEIVKHWQRSRSSHGLQSRPIDLNVLMSELIREVRVAASHLDVRLDTGSTTPQCRGVYTEVQRLCRFLLKNAVSAAQQGAGRVTIRLGALADKAEMRVEDTGPSLPPEPLSRLFDPSFPGRTGTDRLELAACAGIVRRLSGTVHAEEVPGGGVAVVVRLPAI